MSEDGFGRLREILSKVLTLPESERAAYLDVACAGDASLRAEVDRIVAADAQGNPALQTGGVGEWMRAAGMGAASPQAEGHPVSVGPYRIVRLLGEGGMGAVYLAEQAAPIRREVALKLIKVGMDTREVIARFESERQALALMNHANVARVYDAGSSEQGRPYFVMEYAPGLPITDFCDAERLSMPRRLEIFAQVCMAIHHAHQTGIIHRDVKPANVLVAVQDGRPVPKVIDFGVAKAIHQRLTERTLFTERGLFVGTPEYMSPEQADTSLHDVDATTDVYSLGVLLYELLTGVLPFDRREFRRGGWEAMQRRICEQDPPRPSDRLSALSRAGAESSARRGASPSELRRQIRGELDWIVMKAIDRDPRRRYPSAASLAEDVGHYLRGEPVLAGPPSVVYRVRKYAWRHRAPLIVASIVVASLAIALAQSNRERAGAENARRESEAVTQFLVQMLGAADPRNQGRGTPIGEILDRAAEDLGGRFDRQPLMNAGLRYATGTAYSALGDFAAARTHLRVALEIWQRELGAEHRTTLAALNQLAIVDAKQGRSAEAESLHARVLRVQRRKFGNDDPETLESMANLATVWADMGRREEATTLTREAVDGLLRVRGESHRSTLESMHNLANLYREAGRHAEAESLHRRVLAVQVRTLAPDHPELLASMNALAVAYKEMKRHAEAESLFSKVAEARQRTLGPEHPETLTALNNLASLHFELGHYTESATLHAAILDVRRRVLGNEHPHTLISIGNLGDAYSQAGDPARAAPLLREAVMTAARKLGEAHPIHSVTLRKYGVCLGKLKRHDEAEAALVRALGLIRASYGPDHERTHLAERDLAELREARRKSGAPTEHR